MVSRGRCGQIGRPGLRFFPRGGSGTWPGFKSRMQKLRWRVGVEVLGRTRIGGPGRVLQLLGWGPGGRGEWDSGVYTVGVVVGVREVVSEW